MHDLPHNAVAAEAGGFVTGRETDQASDQLQHSRVDWPSEVVDHTPESRRGLGELMNENAKLPLGQISVGKTSQPCLDNAAQNVFRRSLPVEGFANRVHVTRSHGLAQDLRIKSHLGAEVIVHERDVGARASADLANRGSLVAGF